MDAMDKAIQVIVNKIDPEQIVLFGSRARGDHLHDSDYDLLVLKKNCFHKRKLAQDVYCSMRDIGAPVDVIVEDSGIYEAKKHDNSMIYSSIVKEGRVVYERS